MEPIINTDDLSLLRLLPNDVERARVNCALFWEMGISDDHLRGFLADDHNILIVAEIKGQPIGQLIGYVQQRWDVEKPMLFLFSIDVIESHRRQGIGSQLIRRFQQLGIETGCGSLYVITNASNMPAMRMYEALGGTRTNTDDVMFVWEL
ncbi:MAG: GNAT family N-acetyltransferase [bacterium]